MTILNKPTRAEIAQGIRELYVNTRKVNTIAGFGALTKDRYENQLQAVKSELNETVLALGSKDLVEVVDGCCDLLVTLSELVMIMDGNDDLTKNAPRYLNVNDFTTEELVPRIRDCIEEGNIIDALGYTEDLTYILNADMIHNMKSVGESNLSKFTLEKDIDESGQSEFDLCQQIQEKGRYADVYSETVNFDGEDWVVFKSKYDITNDEKYPKGKFLKSPLTFFEPSIVIYES